MLLECPEYHEVRRTFSLQSTLSDILVHDRGKVSNVVTFLHSTGLAKLVGFPFNCNLSRYRLFAVLSPLQTYKQPGLLIFYYYYYLFI
jgi:hypothetical protein